MMEEGTDPQIRIYPFDLRSVDAAVRHAQGLQHRSRYPHRVEVLFLRLLDTGIALGTLQGVEWADMPSFLPYIGGAFGFALCFAFTLHALGKPSLGQLLSN